MSACVQDKALERACWFLWLATLALNTYYSATRQGLGDAIRNRLLQHAETLQRHARDWADFVAPAWPHRETRRQLKAIDRYLKFHGDDDGLHFYECPFEQCAACDSIADRFMRRTDLANRLLVIP